MTDISNYRLPETLVASMANRAAQIARKWMTRKGWKSGAAISSVYMNNSIGIKSDVKYLMYQEQGTRPYVMWNLEGKMIPIKGFDGKTRTIRATGVGRPGWVNIPGRGRVWRDQKWKHPGLKAQNFMRDAIDESIDEHQPQIRRAVQKEITKMIRGQIT